MAPRLDPELSVRDNVKAGAADVVALLKRYDEVNDALSGEADPERLAALAENAGYVGAVEATVSNFRHYLQTRPKKTPQNAYFSMEYGFHESLPIYSGGLGILAGDHIKAASDLGLSLTGIGMFYHEGYFRQQLTPEGQQREVYEDLLAEELPLVTVTDK
ncbi:MAG: DUF3417 domain-containing protein, partial [Anaerolineae bacterium]|nr:DUF3417 domain-containing protein [Anaerolineae bacterium]